MPREIKGASLLLERSASADSRQGIYFCCLHRKNRMEEQIPSVLLYSKGIGQRYRNLKLQEPLFASLGKIYHGSFREDSVVGPFFATADGKKNPAGINRNEAIWKSPKLF